VDTKDKSKKSEQRSEFSRPSRRKKQELRNLAVEHDKAIGETIASDWVNKTIVGPTKKEQ